MDNITDLGQFGARSNRTPSRRTGRLISKRASTARAPASMIFGSMVTSASLPV